MRTPFDERPHLHPGEGSRAEEPPVQLSHDRLRFVHADPRPVVEVERLQETLQRGPCRDSIDRQQAVVVDDVATAGQWPELVAGQRHPGPAGRRRVRGDLREPGPLGREILRRLRGLGRRIQRELQWDTGAADVSLLVTVSIGAAVTLRRSTAKDLLAEADQAMCRAKQSGGLSS